MISLLVLSCYVVMLLVCSCVVRVRLGRECLCIRCSRGSLCSRLLLFSVIEMIFRLLGIVNVLSRVLVGVISLV